MRVLGSNPCSAIQFSGWHGAWAHWTKGMALGRSVPWSDWSQLDWSSQSSEAKRSWSQLVFVALNIWSGSCSKSNVTSNPNSLHFPTFCISKLFPSSTGLYSVRSTHGNSFCRVGNVWFLLWPTEAPRILLLGSQETLRNMIGDRIGEGGKRAVLLTTEIPFCLGNWTVTEISLLFKNWKYRSLCSWVSGK